MPPAVVFFEIDLEVEAYHRREDEWPTGWENWDEELLAPGRMVYVGQGQVQFLRIDEVELGMMWPKRRKKKKKKKASSTPPPPPSAPAPASPAPIDWGDWEELCQAAPPLPPPPPPVPEIWEFPYEELCQAAPVPTPWEPED
jgi:hypothetical protein